jgi:DNA-binding response OmpR family regulator/tetratricopeptide (TPR) repeat protein
MGQSWVTRVLVVARRDPQEPIGGSLKRAGYAVLEADGILAAARSLEHARPDVVVTHEHALTRRDTESLSAMAAQHDIPMLVVSHSTTGGPRASADSLAQRIEELLAQSRSGRTGAGKSESERLTTGPLVVDLEEHTVQVGGVPLDLTTREFELLCHFARRPGRVWSRQQLIDLVWGHDYVDPHVVTVHIGNLRKKLEAASTAAAAGAGSPSAAAPVSIEGVRGVGYRLVHCDGHAAALPPAHDGGYESDRPPFVGRERELEVLRRTVGAAMRGEVRGVAIVGDPGIGKTRLADEAASYTRDRGGRVYWGRCRDASAKPVYEPWVEIMEQWRREDPTGGFDQVFAPEPPGDARSPVEGESARLRLFDRLTGAVRQKADAGLLCVVIDDVHWADPSTLLALRFILGHLRDVPVTLLLTYRPGEATQVPHLTEVVTDLVRGESGTVISLGPLSQNEVGLFGELSGLEQKSFESGTGTAPAAGGKSAWSLQPAVDVYRETEGNPFLVVQLVRLLLLQGGFSESSSTGLTLSREEGVRRVVLGRLSRLSASCREALDVASIVGREFSGPVLAGTMELAPEVVLERLAEAIDTHILLTREEAPEVYRFAHSIFQEVIRGELSPRRRATLHAQVGTVLECLHSDELDAYSADLAHHFSEAVPAGFAPRAIDHCLRAGRVAVAQCAWDEACAQLRRALDLIDLLPAEASERDPVLAGRVWEQLGDVYAVGCAHERALEAYEQAVRRVLPEERVWRARLKEHLALANQTLLRFDRATTCLAEADALLGPPTEEAQTSWWNTWIGVQRDRAWVHFHEGRYEELYRFSNEIEKTMGKHGDARERAHFQRVRVLAESVHLRHASTSETQRLAEECAKSFREAGSPLDLLYAERVLAEEYLWSPEKRPDLHDDLVRFLEMAERSHAIHHRFSALWLLAIWHRLRGEVDAVRDHALATSSLLTDLPGIWTGYGGEAKSHLSWVAWRRGELGRARTLSTEGLREMLSDQYSPFQWQARWTLLGLALHDEDWGGASLQAAAMLDRLQEKMPDELDELLQRLVDEHARDGVPSPGTVETLTTTARASGYL